MIATTAAVKTIKASEPSANAANKAVADIGEKVQMHYSLSGVDEPGVWVPLAAASLAVPKPPKKNDQMFAQSKTHYPHTEVLTSIAVPNESSEEFPDYSGAICGGALVYGLPHKKLGGPCMKTFAEIIKFFEEHDNCVPKKMLMEEFGFKDWKFQEIKYSPHLVRVKKGMYGLKPSFQEQLSISLPEGTLRPDRQTFIPKPGVSQAEIEAAIVARVTQRAAKDHLLLKDITFSGNHYDLSFFPGRYSKFNNHVVFDAFVEHPQGNLWRADQWDRKGHWELGSYFRSLNMPSAAEYPNVVGEVMSVVHSRHGDPGRVLQLSEGNYHIRPVTMGSETNFFSKGRFDPVSKTYQFNETFLQAGSDSHYKNKFMDTMDDLKLSSKRFLSITFKKTLAWAGVALSVNHVASANDKVDAAMEEVNAFGGGVVGSITGVALTGVTGPLGFAAALLGGAIGSESMVLAHRAIRYYRRTSDQNTLQNSNSTEEQVNPIYQDVVRSLEDKTNVSIIPLQQNESIREDKMESKTEKPKQTGANESQRPFFYSIFQTQA